LLGLIILGRGRNGVGGKPAAAGHRSDVPRGRRDSAAGGHPRPL